MRVLFVAHSFPRFVGDVAGSFLHRLAGALQTAGATVRVVAPGGPGLASEDEVAGVAVRRVRYAPRRHETLAYTGTMADAVRGGWAPRFALGGLVAATAARVRSEARRWRADLIHAHWWFPGGLSATLPLVAGKCPVVLTLHGSDVRLARTLAPARALYATVARRAATVTAVSAWLSREAQHMAPDVPCEVARMPVDAARFTPPPDDAPREGVLFVGRLTAQKGVDRLLAAMARASHGARLTVCGSGPEEARLRHLAHTLGIAERVEWAPVMGPAALAAYYRRAAVLAVPSTEEGLGLVAVEAGLCETPAVGFASGGLPDVIQDARTGRLVPPGDVDGFASAIDDLLARPDEARRLGRNAAAAAGDFRPEVTAARFLAVYHRVQAQRRGPA